MFLSHESVSHRHNQPHCEYSSGKWRKEIEVRFCSQIEQTFRLESFLFSQRRRGSLAFRRKQSDEEVKKLSDKSGCSENCPNLRIAEQILGKPGGGTGQRGKFKGFEQRKGHCLQDQLSRQGDFLPTTTQS